MSDSPFGNFGFMGDLMKMLGQQGPDSWFETARALASTIARGDDADPNPLPQERQRLEQYSELVARHIEMVLGIPQSQPIEAATRTLLTNAALDDWRPLLEPSTASQATPAAETEGLGDAMAPLLGQLSNVMGPLFLGFQLGSAAGHFSETAWSRAALALPRLDSRRLIVVNNVAHFAQEWSLDHDHATIYALAQEMTAATFLTHDGTMTALQALLFDAVRDAQAAQGDIMNRLTGLMQSGDISEMMSNPERLLEGIELGEETSATAAIDAATAALRAAIDALAAHVTRAMVGPTPLLDEALRRHRRTDARGEDGAAALFGISLRGERVDEAERFVQAVIDQFGIEELTRMFQLDGLPSVSEIGTPELWVTRVRNSPFA